MPVVELIESVIGDELAAGTTGVKLSYTAPATGAAAVVGVFVFYNSGTPTIQLRVTKGGVTALLRQDTASYREVTPIHLEGGDTLDLNVSATAAVTFDAFFSVEEYA